MPTITILPVNEYAARVMDMIGDAFAEGAIPTSVNHYHALHQWCDANDFLLDASVPWGTDLPADVDPNQIWVDVETEVQRRLRARTDVCTNPNHSHGERCNHCRLAVYYHSTIGAYQHEGDEPDCFLHHARTDVSACTIA